MSIRVIKIGGSLLNLPDLSARINAWKEQVEPMLNLFVVGGGQLIDAIRQLDEIHELDVVKVHWWCIDLLDTTARVASTILPEMTVVESNEELQHLLADESQRSGSAFQQDAIVHVNGFYAESRMGDEESENMAEPLPLSWETTSDSLAALLTLQVGASELILFKSVDVDPSSSTDAASWRSAGIVDNHFPRLAQKIPFVQIVNLRSSAL